MAALAARPHVTCKLSGLVTESGANWTVEDLAPYAAHILQTFGAGRVQWGSDWPVVDLAGGYDRWHAAASELTASLPADERAAIFGRTAERAYLSNRGRR
jgi:L-fuconolactonase